ncbi:putative phosphonate catabolism associated alcohol dehydrogenase [Flavobacterium flevense]|uniref:alcohol dehydrogenase n=1 Tax=Flavobacterium flevense TaxID=983 RepID=A0A4Y4ATQ2_9FLAO|nr:zinc-binding dehydrogenase [Flavobacterium flevense]GEC71618.1 alcohol dehydrogenase [Flavobacterium flevense]SHL48596.1 putative phosphonate catabolism associated alcohol dehydrogenase [Flavobacterium flevense]
MSIKATAMVFTATDQPFANKQISLKDIDSNEVLVRIVYTTICTSDLHTYTGKRSSPTPCVLGHEIIGEITTLGKKIKSDYNGQLLKVGDLVTWCVYAYDDKSKMAKKGIPQKSDGLYKYGHHKFDSEDGLNGGFATHCILKKGSTIFKLPDFLNYKQAAPLNCTHATIAGAIRLARYLTNKNVMITGAGMLGLSACAMAKEGGAKNVFAMDINKERLDLAKKFGANKLIDGKLSADEIKTLIPKEKIDVIIDTTGIAAVMEKGLELLAIGGRAIWIGAVYTQPPTQINAEMIVRNLITIKGLHNYTPNDLGFAVDFIAENHSKYPFEILVSKEFPLNELSNAFEEAKTGKHYRIGVKQ